MSKSKDVKEVVISENQKDVIKSAISGLLHAGYFNRAYNLELVLKELERGL